MEEWFGKQLFLVSKCFCCQSMMTAALDWSEPINTSQSVKCSPVSGGSAGPGQYFFLITTADVFFLQLFDGAVAGGDVLREDETVLE